MLIQIGLIIIGFILLIKGADFLVTGASNIAKKFHIPEIIIGLTIVSIGTSMPELFVSITSAIDEHPDLVIGNVIGSNISNLLLILGISTILRGIKFQKETKLIEIPITIAVSVIFFIMCNTNGGLSQVEGYILLALFICFIGYTVYRAKKGDSNSEIDDIKETNTVLSCILIILGIVGLKFGGDFVVNASINIGTRLGINEKLISLTIVAIGTSLPELVTSVTAAVKGDSDIAVGNILGSNIFNILLILGVSSSIWPIAYLTTYNVQSLIMIGATICLGLFPFIGKKNEMTKSNGIIFFVAYIIYMTLLIVQETGIIK